MKKLTLILLGFLAQLILVAAHTNAAATEDIVFYHNDIIGNPVAATDESGAVIWQESYTAFGEKTIKDESSDNNPLAFTGHYQDRESGLVYMGARYYSPELGRFISTDPADFMSQVESNPMLFNRYAYANNSPYTYVDPDGRSPAKIIGVAAGAYTLYETYQTYQNEGAVAAVKTAAVGAVLSATGLGTIKVISKGLKWAKGKIKAGSGPQGTSPPVDVAKGKGGGDGGGTFPDAIFSKKAPKQTTPGTKTLEGQYINDKGRVEPWKAHYDDHGRQIGRTDYNAGNKAQEIPSTHHHTKEYNAEFPLGRSTGDHIPGEYKP